ncbi:unnamed protein product, partial [marine sediment metagenome]
MPEALISTASAKRSEYMIREIGQKYIVREPLESHAYTVVNGLLPLLYEQKSKGVILDFDLAKLTPYSLVDIDKSSDITTEIETLLNLLVSKKIIIPKPAEIRRYLMIYTDMIHIILPICGIINEKLNAPAQVSLEAYKDTEIKDEYLVIYVRQAVYDDKIMNIIDEISEECDGLLHNKSGWLIITT